MKIIGLTGGMGSGKSTIAEMLKSAHVPVIDADELARLVTAPNSDGLKQIVKRFGSCILNKDQSLNRSLLGRMVFDDADALRDLENIVHPAIEKLRAEIILKLESIGQDIIVYVAPLLFEKDLERYCDKTLLVLSPKEQIIARVKARDGLSIAEIEKRLAFQMSDQKKMAKADEIIFNDSTKESLLNKLRNAWKRLCNKELFFDEATNL